MKNLRKPLLATSLVLLTALLLPGCDSAAGPEPMPPPPEVGVMTARMESMPQVEEFTGRIEAAEVVHLRPRVSGYIARVHYEEGADVDEGDVLFEIDEKPYRAALDQAEAGQARAQARYDLARTELERARKLLETSTIPVEHVDQRRAALRQADAELRAANAATAMAQLDLDYTRVRAPIAGRAGRAAITAGNLATADATLLTTIRTLDPVHVYFEAEEQRLTTIRRSEGGQGGHHDANEVRVMPAGENGFMGIGRLDFLDNHVDPATGTVQVRAVMPNPEAILTPGQFVRVRVIGSVAVEQMLIHDRAILTDQDRKFVYVVDEQGLAQRQDVVIGRSIDGMRIIETGLEAGSVVIVEGTQRVYFPGMPVQATLLDPISALAGGARVSR